MLVAAKGSCLNPGSCCIVLLLGHSIKIDTSVPNGRVRLQEQLGNQEFPLFYVPASLHGWPCPFAMVTV